MSDLDLIEQLGDRLGRPLIEVSEKRLERYLQARYGRDRTKRTNRDAYSLAKNGTVSGLLLQPVTSELLYDFPFNLLVSIAAKFYLLASNVKFGLKQPQNLNLSL